jgi:hypothetical protein
VLTTQTACPMLQQFAGLHFTPSFAKCVLPPTFLISRSLLTVGRLSLGRAYQRWGGGTCTKSHIHFPELKFCQIIRPVQRLCVVFRNKDRVLGWRVVSPLTNPQYGGPPTVGCPQLRIQYIRSLLNIWRQSPISATRGRAMPW